MVNIYNLDKDAFSQLCLKVLAGLGILKAQEHDAQDVDQAYRVEITRESSDKMFKTVETWLSIFQRSPATLDINKTKIIADAAIGANVRWLFLVVFGVVPIGVVSTLHKILDQQDIELILISGGLADSLAEDLGEFKFDQALKTSTGLSFATLRRHARKEVEESPWAKHFQTVSIQPARILPLQDKDSAPSESDLVRATHGGSFMLIGEPGSGKTTCLLALAKDLATIGPLTPVVVPLGRYRGNFWETICEALAPGAQPVTKATAKELLESGALILLLDGINELQQAELQTKLVDEINALTAPDEMTSNSRWVISSRVHDFQQKHYELKYLEARRWEMQPFTADLIYQFLADALGKVEGLALYNEMGESVRELCANPLLLNMVLAVHKKNGKAPIGRGALYRQFVHLMLQWGSDRQLLTEQRQTLDRLWPEPLTAEAYRAMAQSSLAMLAASVSSTQVPWTDARRFVAGALTKASDPLQAAAALLDELIRRGILRCDLANRVSFFHHTFQEYFQALRLLQRPVDELIPLNGIAALNREAVIFVAGLMPDPSPLAQRALKVDPLLAFEIVRDAPSTVPKPLIEELALVLWENALQARGYTGASRNWAILFKRLAALLDSSAEDLAHRIDCSSDETTRVSNLMHFYSQLGDSNAQTDVLGKYLNGQDVPEKLLFRAAIASYQAGDFKRVIDLYTRYLEKNPGDSAAISNRALAYQALGQENESIADFEHANKVGMTAIGISNYAGLLIARNRRDEAVPLLRKSIQLDPNFSSAHHMLADILEDNALEESLIHREQAVKNAIHDDDLRRYLAQLSATQKKANRHGAAIRTLRQMISMDPTSANVKLWKQEIAAHRQALDAEDRKRTVRERLIEHGELPLPTLVVEWLKAAGLQVAQATANWVIAQSTNEGPNTLPVTLMPEPRITASSLRASIATVRSKAWQSKQILVVTAAEILDLDARHQWAAMQDELTLGLVSAMEIRDALLQNDMECRRLLDRTLSRSGKLADPFEYKGIVREPTEFFGRHAEIADLTAYIGSGRQVGIYGIHKIGKSSLIEQLRRNLHVSHPEITAIQIELDGTGQSPGDFFRRVLEKLPGVRDLPPSRGLTAENFRGVLAEFHNSRLKSHPNHRLLLIVDEYPFLIPDLQGKGGLPGFIEVLALLKTLFQEGWVLILPCGRSAALNRQAGWTQGENPFVGLLRACFLGPLPKLESDALLTTLGCRAGMTFPDDALQAVFDETAGHPALGRSLGSQLLRAGTGRMTPLRVEEAVKSFLKDRDQTAILRAIYEDRMDQDEQQIARTLATRGPQPKSVLFPPDADVSRRRQIRDALQNLIDTTVMMENADGTVKHRYRLLERLVRAEAEELGMA